MPLRSITTARFNMSATLLHQNEDFVPEGDINLDLYGEWVESQDPLTGEIIKVWEPHDEPITPPTTDPGVVDIHKIKCLARGIVDGGIRVAGNTERFGDTYENMEYVKFWTPGRTKITKRDRITNIRTPDGHVRWTDEEFTDPHDPNSVPKATVFNVNGVTPLFDAFNKHVENFILLERAEVYE